MKPSFALAAAAAGATLLASLPATAQPVRFDPTLKSSPLLTDVQFRGHGGRRFHGGGFGHRGFGGYHGGYRRGWRGGRGAAIGAGVAGLAAGALIGGALASQPAYGYGNGYYGDPGYAVDPGYGYGYAAPVQTYAAPVQTGDASAYCAQRFKSYDPASGTYLGYDGARHPCP